MSLLSREAFARARHFLRTVARPLDRALFEYRFEEAPAERVLAELARYRNDDGGFGHSLEPDLRTPSSSAIATRLALHTLIELETPADHPLVRGAVAYLLATIDREAWIWRPVPEDANDYPHAPWWHDEDGSLARTFDGYLVIPRAELAGYLYYYAELVPPEWLADLAERTVQDILGLNERTAGEGGDSIVSALCLAEAPGLPAPLRERLVARLREAAPLVVNCDSQSWGTYACTPLKAAPAPDALLADLFREDLEANLDYEIAHQTAEGAWDPTWSWGDFYPQVWPMARREWQGELTLSTLTRLRAFGRIEGTSGAPEQPLL